MVVRKNLLQQDLQNRARVAIQGADETIVDGAINLKPGEAVVEVKFPVTFSEEPFPILGMAEMSAEAHPEHGFYPVSSGTVVRWIKDGNGRYTGAVLALKVRLGKPDLAVRVKYKFEGVALSNGGQ